MISMVIGKKGAAHFEMIISFIFFIGFVFFLFIALKPYDTMKLSGAVVSGLYVSFEDETHTNLTETFLKANYTGSAGCFYIGLDDRVFRYALSESLVKDISNSEVESEIEGDNLNIDSDEVFYKVSISPEFQDGNLAGCEVLEDYTFGMPLERRVVSYSSLEDLADRYVDDYENLKEDLGVPAVFDFAITSENLPEINMERLIPRASDVIAQDYILEVLKSDGTVTNVRFNLLVW